MRIDKDGTVTVTVNRLEFGQGVLTALPMILAEELDADWARVRSVHGDADAAYVDPVFGMHLTGGSGSIKHSFTQYRELGARARAMLLAAAAAQWGVDPGSLRTENGRVIGAGGKTMTYGDLAEAAMTMPVPQKVTLKEPKDFRLIGKATLRLDARAKSTGTENFGIDVKLPGMLTAVVVHPPVFGAKLKTVNDSAAKAIPGVKAVLRMPTDRGGEGVAVVAQGYWAASQGRDALKLEWDTAAVEKVDSVAQLARYQALAKKTGLVKFKADMAPLATAPKKISAEFTFPYLAHAPMEPLNCTVQVTGQGADAKANLWLGTQMPGFDALAAAKVLEVAPNNVKVNVQMAGGGFGRRAVPTADYVVEACTVAKLARATQQDPVAYRLQLLGDKHPRHKAALMLAVEQSGYGKRKLPAGQAWGVAVHESFDTVVAYVAEASVTKGVPKLHAVTAGVHCNLAVNPKTIEAQVQGAALMGLGTCLPGAAITFKDGVVEQSNFADYIVARLPDMPRMAVHIVPSAEAPTGMGEPGLPPLAPAFANAIAKLTGKTPRGLPFKLA